MKFGFKGNTSKEALFNLFGHIRARVYITDNLYLDIGRFSFGILSRIRLCSNANFSGLAARVGDYCEFSECDVLLGGEHNNSEVANFNFSSSPVFQKLLVASGLDVRHSRKGVVEIGDGVIVGYGAILLSGASIGDGAVIAAGAVVTRPCQAFSIYAGNPAKLIKHRNIDHTQFQQFMRSTVQGAYHLLTGKLVLDEEIDAARQRRVVIRLQYLDSVKGGPFNFQILGALIDEHILPLREGSEFQRHCAQVTSEVGKEITWVSDPLNLEM